MFVGYGLKAYIQQEISSVLTSSSKGTVCFLSFLNAGEKCFNVCMLGFSFMFSA